MPSESLVVVKVGGSLFNHPNLGPGLQRWLAERPSGRYLLVPGGGAVADVIRDYHRTHQLSQEACHWLALCAMDINGRVLRQLVPGAAEVHHPHAWPVGGSVGVLNAIRFALTDDSEPGALPHDWSVTSDAIAARAAELANASLMMLKSVDLPEGISWTEASDRGLVDPMFGYVVSRAGTRVVWVNLRQPA